jgi:hypothetical protein
MDESFAELESELKRLRPRAPSASLVSRIGADLARTDTGPGTVRRASSGYRTATTWSSWKWLNWRTAAIAAAALALAATGFVRYARSGQPPVASASAPRNPGVAAPNAYQAVSVANVLYEFRDEGLVATADNTPAQRVRYRYVDTYVWKDPKNNASIKWSFPRDEVRVVPAAYR